MRKIGRVTGGEKEEGQGWEEGERLVWKKGGVKGGKKGKVSVEKGGVKGW